MIYKEFGIGDLIRSKVSGFVYMINNRTSHEYELEIIKGDALNHVGRIIPYDISLIHRNCRIIDSETADDCNKNNLKRI